MPPVDHILKVTTALYRGVVVSLNDTAAAVHNVSLPGRPG